MILLLVAACAQAPDSAVDSANCELNVTWQNGADGFFRSYCRSCHSSTTADRHEAPVGIDFDSEAQVRSLQSSILPTIEYRTMPPGGGLTDDDVTLIREWLVCGD